MMMVSPTYQTILSITTATDPFDSSDLIIMSRDSKMRALLLSFYFFPFCGVFRLVRVLVFLFLVSRDDTSVGGDAGGRVKAESRSKQAPEQ